MKIETLEELAILGLRELHSAESQIIDALPTMIDHATNSDLVEGLSSHLEETKAHLQRLDDIFEALDLSPRGKKSEIAATLLSEGAHLVKTIKDEALRDVAIIEAAQKVEHYEISAYGTVIAYAKTLGEVDMADLLEVTLQEEKGADQKLTEVAKQANPKALRQEDLVAA